MKKLIASLLLFCFSAVALAAPQNHDSDLQKQVAKIEAVTPSLDLGFQVAVYLPLDVYAPVGQSIDYSFEKTESGFTALQEKPPLKTQEFTNKPHKKWIWCSELVVQGSNHIKEIPERLSLLSV
ncbi:hypothetical protein [Emticicia sp. BO119]|uniref:hypothetical protein n=1 Tax=Emticicia sp. BO119 TaxID=2757768 RepID=UPI0015F0579D|nr:hypothetical protein [Emticicia sp. BO119]MBA4852056.1 hypothetical protein [Emticicia sp. BO119]